MAPQIRIIHEDEDCLVVHQPGHSAFSLITFGSIGQRPNGNWFWAKEAASKLGLDTIGIVPKSDHRYPRSVVAPLVPVISAHSQAIRVGYGFSMGAYGALKHGRLLGLTHVLALSPVNYALTSAHIRRIIGAGGFCPERSQGPLISCQETAPVNVQVLDPFFPLDLEQGELFASAGGIRTIKTPFMDHFTVGLMRNTATLQHTLELLFHQDFAGISALLNHGRRKAPGRASNLARGSLARGNRVRANKLLQKALDQGVKSEAVEQARISGLVEYGRRHLASRCETGSHETEAFIEKTSLEHPNALRLQRELAHWCLVYGAPKAALGPLRRAVEIAPDDVDRWLALGRALHMLGQTKEAVESLVKARDTCCDSAELTNYINSIKQKPSMRIAQNRWEKITKRLKLALSAIRKPSFLKS
jgi:hypothetical protein